MFSCEICEIFKNSFFTEHLQNNHPSILETNESFSLDIIKFKSQKSAISLPKKFLYKIDLNPLSANPTKWSNTLNNSSAVADELFECVWPFCGVDA